MATPWEPVRLGTQYSFGRPFIDKPSFDGLPPESTNIAQASLFAADRAAADWERVELLFERNWFGPCACLGHTWISESSSELPPSDADATESGSLVDIDVQPSSATCAAGGLFRLFGRRQPRLSVIKPQSYCQPELPNSITDQAAAFYGAAAAPIPEPAFISSAAQESSPQKAMPVPKRMISSTLGNGDGHLPPAVAIDPSEAPVPKPAQPLSALPTHPSRATSQEDAAEGALRPQLGTWADRQYRLLDPVPERGEFGPGSNSGNSSVPSSSSNTWYPNQSQVNVGVTGSNGNGIGHSNGVFGSGSGGGELNSGNLNGNDIGGAVKVSSSQGQGRGQVAISPSLSDPLYNLRQGQQHQQEHSGRVNHDDQRQHQHQFDTLNGGQALPKAPPQAQALGDVGPDATEHPQQQQIDTEALIQEAAWRWRFTRRWQAEQARTDPDQASSAPRDQMEEALAYLQATNATTTVSMQIGNVRSRGGGAARDGSHGSRCGLSMDGSLMLTGMVGTLGAAASTLGGDWPLAACGSGSGSFTSGPRILGRQASGEMLAASREVASMNRRAAKVLQQQMDCDLEAERRVQESLGQGQPWVGQFIPIVQIDEWGSFRFLMLKLRDQFGRGGGGGVAPGSERQRIVIRGHNYGSEGQLMEECNREILALSQKHCLPFEAPTCMGGGVMEWRRDRDRHLHLHSGFVMDRALPMATTAVGGMLMAGAPTAANGSRPASATDLLNLAAALARQSFPPTYKITVLA